jgi:hypothetical protein
MPQKTRKYHTVLTSQAAVARMDPISSLSIAAAVVQFLDFGSKLVGRGLHIYKSADGTIPEYVDREIAIGHLNDLTTNLQALSQDDTATAASRRDQALADLCSKCQSIGGELLTRLAALKVDGNRRKWKSFEQALKSVWSEKAMNDVERRLATFRNEIEFHILVDLRYATLVCI